MSENDRIHLIPKHEAPESLHQIYDKADSAMVDGNMPGPTLFGNQVRALAHNPELLKALLQVYEVFGATSTTDRKLTELGILIVSRINACDYCFLHHAPLAHESGLSQAQLNCIEQDNWNDRRDLWSDKEWVLIQYAEQLTREPYKIKDALFDELHIHFIDKEIVDITMRLALCSAWNRFNDALGIDSESAFQHAFAELMKS